MHDAGVRLGGRYRLDERVGAGGMGEVWRATDEVLGRAVAVKVMLPALLDEPGFGQRFFAEARAMASVRHPGVAAIHDYRSDSAGAFLVMEYVEGEALSRTLGRVGRLDAATTMSLVGQAADALQAAHDMGIVHRDVKPGNLLIRPDGTVVLTDFGIARAQAYTALTTDGAVLGTPSYLAPEQVLGEAATPRSDVYALGVVAYECLAGRRPFSGENPFAVAMQRVREAPPALDGDVPGPVRAVVDRALATDPAHRWRCAADLAVAARQAVPGLPAARPAAQPGPVPPAGPAALDGRPPSRTPAPATAARRRRHMAVAAVVLVGVVLVGAGLWVRGKGSPGANGSPGAVGSPGANGSPGGTAAGSTVAGSAVAGSAVAGSAVAGSTAAGSAVPAAPAALAGFVPCGGVYCPAVPMCWGGLVIISGEAHVPRRIDCAKPHYWETFAVGHLPPDAVRAPQDELMDRADIAGVCAESVLAGRSRDPAGTQDWRREPLAVQAADAQTWLLHCLAGSPDGESTGAMFRSVP